MFYDSGRWGMESQSELCSHAVRGHLLIGWAGGFIGSIEQRREGVMMLDKCPICGEPRLRFSSGVNRFACGTIGPYIKDGEEEYDTGHTCDIHTYSRLFTQMEKERGELQQRLAAAEAAARWWRMAARGYILAEGEVHPDERWPWLVDEAADEAAKGGRDET